MVDVHLDDLVRMRKPHPCGSFEWRIVRIGADIGLRCMKCQHRVLMPRSLFERRLKAIIGRIEPERDGDRDGTEEKGQPGDKPRRPAG